MVRFQQWRKARRRRRLQLRIEFLSRRVRDLTERIDYYESWPDPNDPKPLLLMSKRQEAAIEKATLENELFNLNQEN